MELQGSYAAFQNAGAEIVALAVAPLASVDGARQVTHAEFPMLSDANHKVAEAYGVYNLLGDGYAAPSVFIIDTDGRIAWRRISQNATSRPAAQRILQRLQEALNE